MVTRRPPVTAASATPAACGRMASSSPWITSTGQRTRSQTAAEALAAARVETVLRCRSASPARSPAPSRRSPRSASCECGSVNNWPKKNSRKSAVVASPVVGVVLRPALGVVDRHRRTGTRCARGGLASAAPPGRSRRGRAHGRDGRRRPGRPTARRTTAPTSTARSVPVASSTAMASAANSSWL